MRLLDDTCVSWLGCARQLLVTALLIPACMLASVGFARAEPILSVGPASSNVTLGDVVWIDFFVGATEPGPADDAADLFAYQFGVVYDPLLLSAGGLSEGTFLSTAGSTLFVPGNIDNTAGLITLTANSLIGAGRGAFGAGPLFSVQFAAISVGSSVVSASFNTLNGDGLFDSSLNFISFGTRSGVLTTSAVSVPEPSTVLLLGIGFLVLAGEWRMRHH